MNWLSRRIAWKAQIHLQHENSVVQLQLALFQPENSKDDGLLQWAWHSQGILSVVLFEAFF